MLKGAVAAPALTLEFLGGPEPDGTILEIVGTPTFSRGERSVVFSAGNGYAAVPLSTFIRMIEQELGEAP